MLGLFSNLLRIAPIFHFPSSISASKKILSMETDGIASEMLCPYRKKAQHSI
jgi:hypothetical protein